MTTKRKKQLVARHILKMYMRNKRIKSTKHLTRRDYRIMAELGTVALHTINAIEKSRARRRY